MSETDTRILDRPAVEKKDNRYYYSLITFQIEDCLFRVPPNAFQEQSQIFRDMFSIPTDGKEGNSDDNPIYLAAVETDAFHDFLELLYPQPRREGLDNLAQEAWSSSRWIKILDLARFYKIEVARKHDIKHWYVPAYMALAKRDKPLDIVEADRLGYDFAVKMAQVRERRLIRGANCSRCNPGGGKGETSKPYSKVDKNRNRTVLLAERAQEEEELKRDVEAVFGTGGTHGLSALGLSLLGQSS
ncbi:hypothetical protein M0805_003197 [Coniferiporia weirii]|nr:hypothetical protein M0805_003197 [Coniferiporia weirii]